MPLGGHFYTAANSLMSADDFRLLHSDALFIWLP